MSPPTVTFVPASANQGDYDDYVPNPPFKTTRKMVDDNTSMEITTQPHLKGTSHSTGVLRTDDGDEKSTYYVSLSPILGSEEDSNGHVTDVLNSVVALGSSAFDSIEAAHTEYWNEWWPQGAAITLDHSPLEAFYYVQQYVACERKRRVLLLCLVASLPRFVRSARCYRSYS